MIKITVNDVVNSTEVFNTIMEQTLSGSLAFKIARLVRELNNEMKTFNEERQKLIEKYAIKKEDGQLDIDEKGAVHFNPEDVNKVNSEFDALLSNELELNAEKIPASALNEIKLSPKEMLNVEKFFEE